MAFDTLSSNLQNILLVNHSYITKWFTVLFFLFLSCWYLFSVWKKQGPTKFIFIMAYRMIFMALSLVYLIAFPLIIISLSPEYSFLDWYLLYLNIYKVSISIIFILFFIDLIRYGPFVLLKLAGMNLNDDKVNDIANAIENNKHFLRFKKTNKNGKSRR